MKNKLSILFLVTVVISLITKFSGLIREVITGYFFGASEELDLFYYIYSFPELLMSGLTASIAIALIPVLSKEETLSMNNKIFLNKIITYGIVFFVFLIVIGLCLTEPVLSLVGSNNVNNLNIVWLLSVLQILPTFILSIYLGIETKLEKFKLVTMLSLPFNLIIVISIALLSQNMGITSIAIGMMGGTLAQLLYLMWDLKKKNNYKFKINISVNDESKLRIKEFFIILIPVYFGTVIQRVNIFVDRTLAKSLEVGSISALSYADRIIQMIVSIIVSTIGMIMFSKISSMKDNKDEAAETLSTSLIFSFACILPITAYIAIFGGDIINVLFNRGQFDNYALDLTTTALIGYSIGLIGICVRYLLNRVYFANNDVKTPTINTIVYCVVNLILSILFSKYFGLFGIVIASSLTMILSCISLTINLQKKYNLLNKLNWRSLVKLFVCTIFLSILWIVVNELSIRLNPLMRLMISGTSGCIVYIFLMALFKIENMNALNIGRRILQRKFINKKKVNASEKL